MRLEPLENRCLLTSYVLTNLGSLGGAYITASDINASGQVVGRSETANGSNHAFLWTNEVMIDLGTLGGSFSQAMAINDLGQIVGDSYNAAGVDAAFLLNPEDTNGDGSPDRWFRDVDGNGANDLMTELARPVGATSSFASDINNAGQVVGHAGGAALLWTAAGMTDLGSLGGGQSSAMGINDSGQVVGFSNNATQQRRAFLWDSTHGMTDLRVTNDVTEAYAINAHGSVVGGVGYWYGFVWTPNEPNGTAGTTTQLAAGNPSAAFDINDAGQIVGTATAYFEDPNCSPDGPYPCIPSWAEQRAVLWENGMLTDLTDNTGIVLESADAINATGQIIAAGATYLGYHAYLLTPVNGPTLSVGDASVVEGHSGTVSAVFTVRLSEASNQTVTVNFATANGTATAGSDYDGQSGTLTFVPGETTKTVTDLVRGDRLGEGNESFVVNLSGATSALIADRQGVGTIVDDEPLLTIESVWRQEGNSGQAAMAFTLTLSRSYDIPVTVDYTTVDGSAIAGSDYIAAAGTAMIAAGQTTGTIIVQVRGDTLPESDEYFNLTLTGSNVANFSNDVAHGNILDDDTPPSISIGDAYMTEGNSGTRSMSFTVSLSRPSGQAVSVNYATANGTAKTSDNDYTAASGRLDFAPGDTTKTITVTIRGDTRKEADEYFLVKLSGAFGATIADGQGQGTIANDDGGGKPNGKGNHSNSFTSAVDTAIDDWMTSPRKKRGW